MRRTLLLLLFALGCERNPQPAEIQTPPPAAAAVVETSRLGELYWVAGQAFVEKGKLDEAGEAFQQALQYFDTEKKPVPAGLWCDAGAALRKKGGDAKAADLAARYLHRCLLTAAAGSPEHHAALRELVELLPLGLDPAAVARDTPADAYLTRTVVFSAEKLKVEVARTTPAGDRGYEAWAKLLEKDAARPVYLQCLGHYADQTHQTRLALLLPLKLHARLGDDDIYEGGTLELLPDPSGASGPAAQAATCLRDGLAPLAVDFAKSGSSGSWSGAVTVTLTIGQ